MLAITLAAIGLITLAGIGLVLVGLRALRKGRTKSARFAGVLAIALGIGCVLSPWMWIAYEPMPYRSPLPAEPTRAPESPIRSE